MSDAGLQGVRRGCYRSTHSQQGISRGGGVVFHGSHKGALLDEGSNTCSPREHRFFSHRKRVNQ